MTGAPASTSAGISTNATDQAATDRPRAVAAALRRTTGTARAGNAVDDLQSVTVDLASRIEVVRRPDSEPSPSPESESEPEPGTDSTAALELRPTVDLSSRLEHEREDSPRRR
jgi:hypothetical protein